MRPIEVRSSPHPPCPPPCLPRCLPRCLPGCLPRSLPPSLLDSRHGVDPTRYDTSGEGIIITSHDKLDHYLRLMTHQMPIESNFIKALADHLNAEIVAGTVSMMREAWSQLACSPNAL